MLINILYKTIEVIKYNFRNDFFIKMIMNNKNSINLMDYDKVEFVENFSFLKKYMYLKSSSFYDKNQEN